MTDNFNDEVIERVHAALKASPAAGPMSSDDFGQFLDRLHQLANEADTGNCVTLTGLTGDELLDELGIK